MQVDQVFQTLQATPWAVVIRENDILFPWIESVHVLAIVLVIGTISIVDLRLLGLASTNRTMQRVLRDVLPVTWIAFAVAATTGSLLFSSKAVDYVQNFFFDGKMILLVLAGLNMAAFHLFGTRDIERWGDIADTPAAAKFAGGFSLCIWIGVVAFGRWIGFTMP